MVLRFWVRSLAAKIHLYVHMYTLESNKYLNLRLGIKFRIQLLPLINSRYPKFSYLLHRFCVGSLKITIFHYSESIFHDSEISLILLKTNWLLEYYRIMILLMKFFVLLIFERLKNSKKYTQFLKARRKICVMDVKLWICVYLAENDQGLWSYFTLNAQPKI